LFTWPDESTLAIAALALHSLASHTSPMNLKTAALLALVGMSLLTAVLLAHFITDAEGWIRDVVPAMRVLTSFIYVLASLSVTVFFLVFQRGQR
jgi:hypothetical protein